MRTASIRMAALLITLSALMTAALAQEGEAACSAKTTVYLSKPALVFSDSANESGRRFKLAERDTSVEVLRSECRGPNCWLQVADGWILDGDSLLSLEARDTATGAGCYQAERAYLTGNMNIRSRASTSGQVVAKARAGEAFDVSQSTRGATWCWLKIDLGWMANTSRVRSTKPAQPVGGGSAPPPASQPANIDNCCFVDRQCTSEQEWSDGYWAFQRNECPVQAGSRISSTRAGGHSIKIDGSGVFVQLMSEALDLLRARSQTWYSYVISGIDWLIEDEQHFTMAAYSSQRTVRAAPYRRHITVSWDYMLNVVRVATGLVHEACHIHRHEAGFESGPYTKVAEEVACIQIEMDMLRVAFPNYANQHSRVGPQHCKGSLENHPRCRGFDV